jgi:hypothetical protein
MTQSGDVSELVQHRAPKIICDDAAWINASRTIVSIPAQGGVEKDVCIDDFSPSALNPPQDTGDGNYVSKTLATNIGSPSRIYLAVAQCA